MSLTNYQRTMIQRERNIAEKKYYCEPCSKVFKDSHDLKNHMKIKKHNPHLYKKYFCSHCNYQTKFKPVYNKHLQCRKHIRLSTPPESPTPELL